MRQFAPVLFFCLALSGSLVTLHAQSSAKVSGFRGIFLSDRKDSEDKLVALAGAIPSEKYSWRPAKGVRSVSEAYMHVAGTNYFVGGPIGFFLANHTHEHLGQLIAYARNNGIVPPWSKD
jgi:hypothetical protein